MFEMRAASLSENKTRTYRLFSNVIKLLWILNLAINEVDMMLYFMDFSLNLLIILKKGWY